MKTQQSKPTRRPGFTLIELLVVITIVVVLVTLAFIASGKIRERAQVANAVNSLRQVGIAHIAYSSENHGAVNTIGLADDEEIEFSGSFWGRMAPYLFSNLGGASDSENLQQLELAISALFQTQDAKTMTGTPFHGIPLFLEAGLPVPLGFNQALQPSAGQQVRMTIFNDPSRIIYNAYGREFFNATHGATFHPMPQNGGPGGAGIYYLDNGIAIVGFLDGHVESLTAPMPARWFGQSTEDSE